MLRQSPKILYCRKLLITPAFPSITNYLEVMKYGISFSLGSEIYSIYRREFDFKHSFTRVKDALLSRRDFSPLANTFCLSFYHINRNGNHIVIERYYSSSYPEYIKQYLKTQLL